SRSTRRLVKYQACRRKVTPVPSQELTAKSFLPNELGPPPRRRPSLQKKLPTYFFAGAASLALAYLRRKRSTRPAVSTRRCLPVKNGWQAEQISTWMSPLWVDRVSKLFPQAHTTRTLA